jgi:hypothetical protein
VSGWLSSISKFVGHRAGEPPRLAAHPAQDGRRASFVVDLHEELTPALLDELGSRRSWRDLHAHLRVDLDPHEAMAVEHALDRRHRRFLVGHFEGRLELAPVVRRKRRALVLGCGDESCDLCDEGLQRHVADNRQARFAAFAGCHAETGARAGRTSLGPQQPGGCERHWDNACRMKEDAARDTSVLRRTGGARIAHLSPPARWIPAWQREPNSTGF